MYSALVSSLKILSSRRSGSSVQSLLFPKPRVIDLFGSHLIFQGLGQALLYYDLLKEDLGARGVETAILTNIFRSVERSAFEEHVRKMCPTGGLPPFSTLLWDTSFSDREFFTAS